MAMELFPAAARLPGSGQTFGGLFARENLMTGLRELRGAVVMMFCWIGLVPVAWGQGLLVEVGHSLPVPLPRPIDPPRPEPVPSSYKIEAIDVQVKLVDQVAEVGMSQTFQNTGSRQMEVRFLFPLPYDSAIDKLTLMVDGKEYAGKLLPADEARKIYEAIVRQNKDPALLEWVGTGLFRTSVFPVPAGAKRTVTLRYTQLCRQSQGLTDLMLPLRTARYTTDAVEKLSVTVHLQSSEPIKSIYATSHQVEIERDGERRAVVKYQATDEIPAADFRLFYDATPKDIGASVVSYRPDKDDAGYFLLLATPEIKQTANEARRTRRWCWWSIARAA